MFSQVLLLIYTYFDKYIYIYTNPIIFILIPLLDFGMDSDHNLDSIQVIHSKKISQYKLEDE